MAKNIRSWNIVKLNEENNAACAALAPALEKAGIKTITVDGKSFPASDAPLADQINTLLSAQPVVADSQGAAEALISNELISKELTAAQTALAIKTTAVETLTKSNADLQAKLSTASGTVEKQTAEIATLSTQREATVSQYGKEAEQSRAMKTHIAQRCIAVNCLDLSSLGTEATAEQKLNFVMNQDWKDLAKAYDGAVNAAFRKTGVSIENIPNATPSGPGAKQKQELTGRARFAAGVKVMFGGAPLSAR